MHGLDEYDSKARWYYPAICRTLSRVVPRRPTLTHNHL